MDDPLMKFFDYYTMPSARLMLGQQYNSLAQNICMSQQPSAERTIALRKLLESRDAAMRMMPL